MDSNLGYYDIVIVGGGIIGLSTAMAMQARFPGRSLAVLEKEPGVALHQTGRNSGVIHSGIYYRPGSHKATLCVEGARLLYAFCRDHGVPCERCGKLIVATTGGELPRLEALYERGRANGIPGLEMIPPGRVREIEPHAHAVGALYSPETGITDYRLVAEAMAADITKAGGRILLSCAVAGIDRDGAGHRIETRRGAVRCRFLVNCAGLQADRVAAMTGADTDVLLLPFRGEYFTLKKGCRLVRNLIYPVPDPRFPFLGVHFTRKINGEYEAGPNAVLAFAREGYRVRDICWQDLAAMARHPAFWKMAWRYWNVQAYELYRSLSRRAFLAALKKLVPELEDRDIDRGGSGVRAQVVTSDGRLADDFIIAKSPCALNVLNAPSPAATASIAIGRHIADLAERHVC